MWRPPPSRLGRTARAQNLLLITPWADQGLGIQAREYAQQALDANWGVFVWALQSRKTIPDAAQVTASEWQISGVDVHYDNEENNHQNVVEYCQQHSITDAFIMEPARKPIFDLALQLRTFVRVWAVPNLEMIRRADLPLFRNFTGVLCVNQHTVDNLIYFKVPKVDLMPFRLRDCPYRAQPCTDVMRFLVVGGFNADRRKQAKKVMLGFSRAFLNRKDVHLTVLSQGGMDFKHIPATFPNIQVRVGPLTYQEILHEYSQHHVVMMCSRAEGLGLPFYEAARAGCAVITLDVPLFREQVDGTNGWLLKASVESIALGRAAIGNDDAIIHTFTFDPVVLTQLFMALTPEKIATAQKMARARYETNFIDNFFTKNLSCVN